MPDNLYYVGSENMPEKPKIEQIISEYLDGDMKKTALEFAKYMRESQIPLKLCTTNTWRWKALYNGKRFIKVKPFVVWYLLKILGLLVL